MKVVESRTPEVQRPTMTTRHIAQKSFDVQTNNEGISCINLCHRSYAYQCNLDYVVSNRYPWNQYFSTSTEKESRLIEMSSVDCEHSNRTDMSEPKQMSLFYLHVFIPLG